MKNNTRIARVALIFTISTSAWLLLPGTLRGQSGARQNPLAHLPALEQKMGPNFANRLSSGGASMFHIAKVLPNTALLRGMNTPQARAALARAASKTTGIAHAHVPGGTGGTGPVSINDASLDFQFSRFAGFTQSETSSAWCGNTIVAGYNDSGALIRSVLDGVGGQSFNGVAVSQDRGNSFTGLSFVNPGSDPGTFLGGDPVLVCSDPQHFYYASLYSHITTDGQGNILTAQTGVSVNFSSSSGFAWESPVPAVTKDANSHFLDKPWLAIDPTTPRNLYITYTDFAAVETDPECQGIVGMPGIGVGPGAHIELVASKDGGNSWSAPVVVDKECNLFLDQNLSGSQVVVGPKGEVYVAYTALDFAEGQPGIDIPKNAEIRLVTSLDGGATFSATPTVVSEATTASSFGFDTLEAQFRTNAFPTLTVDRSNKASRGTLYMVWTDATLNQVPDIVSNFFFGDPVYSFGDIVLSKSADGGNTWSPPKVVSPAPATFQGTGRDQFMAGVAVDPLGNLGVCYSDRRNDPNNLAVDHFCSLSGDLGNTFRDVRETPTSWSPGHLNDVFINPSYMGDYDGVSSDATGANSGFFSLFQMQTNTNPDVFGMRVQ